MNAVNKKITGFFPYICYKIKNVVIDLHSLNKVIPIAYTTVCGYFFTRFGFTAVILCVFNKLKNVSVCAAIYLCLTTISCL